MHYENISRDNIFGGGGLKYGSFFFIDILEHSVIVKKKKKV